MAAVDASAEAVLSSSMDWFSVYLSACTDRAAQRRVVLRAADAGVYGCFWGEAARLYGDEDADADERDLLGVDGARRCWRRRRGLSSLLVLTGGVAEAEAYRAIRQTLALSLALLGLADAFTLRLPSKGHLRGEDGGGRDEIVGGVAALPAHPPREEAQGAVGLQP